MQGWSSYRETEPRSFFVIGTEHGSPCAEKFSMQSGHWMDSEWRIDRCVCLACRAPSDAPLCLAGVEIRCRDCFNPHLHWTFCWVSLIAPDLLKPSPWAAPLVRQDPARCSASLRLYGRFCGRSGWSHFSSSSICTSPRTGRMVVAMCLSARWNSVCTKILT